MALEYTNRRGDTYLLQAGTTATGKPRYWFGRKLTGTPVEEVPEGFEIYEHPEQARVSLRRKLASPILAVETALVSDSIRAKCDLERFIVSVEGNAIVVYLPDMAGLHRLIEVFQGGLGLSLAEARHMAEWKLNHDNYQKLLRFILRDADSRTFALERWCFRGSVDDWLSVDGPAPLDELVERYVHHLDKESFYEM